jgi:hypothetical protein
VLICLAVGWLSTAMALASTYRGQVTFNGLPVPGAIVTAAQANKQFVEVTNPQGIYSFPDLPDGAWTIQIKMTGFSSIEQQVTIVPNMPAAHWELNLLALNEIKAAIHNAAPPEQAKTEVAQAPKKASPETAPPSENVNQLASNGLLINGSVNNSAASPFAQAAAFGNHRVGAKGLYNGGIGLILDNSVLDAQPFSLTGQRTPKPTYNDMTGVVAIGGPLRIPHLLPNGPNVFARLPARRSPAT